MFRLRIIHPFQSQLIAADRGLGALVAHKFAAEGSNIAINYVSNKEAADRVAAEIASKYNVKTIVVQGVCLSFSWL